MLINQKLIPGLLVITIIILLLPAVYSCSNSPPVIEKISLDNSWVGISSTVAVTADAIDPDSDELSYDWSVTGGTITSQSPQAVWKAPDKPGLYSIILFVRDPQGNEVSDQISVCVAGNPPPVIDSLFIEPSAIGQGQKGTITCLAHDPEGEELEYQWEAAEGIITGSGHVISWEAPYDSEVCVIKVKVTDPQAGTATLAININVLPNHSPEIKSLTADPRNINPGMESHVTCEASDVDGDNLQYRWEASGGKIEGSGPKVIWKPPEDCARYDVSVTVEDGRGGSAKQQVRITLVRPGG